MTNRQILMKIKAAKSAGEISALLAEGEMFERASDRTKTRWRMAAERRRKWLEEQAQ